jgi:uncharacterized glyoxalase superfamily protein PhnB
MTFQGIRPMLEANDVKAAVDFYVEALGFTLTNSIDDGASGYEWANVRRDGVGIMFQGRHFHDGVVDEDHPANPIITGSLYINVDDVDAVAAEVSGKVALDYGPVTQDWGMREIGFTDPNGYYVVIGQDLGAG